MASLPTLSGREVVRLIEILGWGLLVNVEATSS